MKATLRRILILLGFGCVILPFIANAQNTGKPVTNPISKIVSSVQSKTKTIANSVACDFSALETAIIEEVNQVRTNPQVYVSYLQEYRKYMKGNVLSIPNKKDLITIEGTTAVDDAISDLTKLSKNNSFEISLGLSKAAHQQVTDLGENVALKHFGKDGSDLEKRLWKIGYPGNAVSENIAYRADNAREIVLNMIIDDGIKSRSHRKNIFNPNFKLFGVACGMASNKKMVCVAQFADSFKER